MYQHRGKKRKEEERKKTLSKYLMPNRMATLGEISHGLYFRYNK